jgi:hypothetical protein
MALPTSGWISTPQRAPLTRFPLPEPQVGTYGEGGEAIGRLVPQAATVLAAGGAQAVAVAGRNRLHGRTLGVTLTRDDASSVLLVDSIDFNYQPPPPSLDRSFRVHARVLVQDHARAGVFHDLTALLDTNWVEEMEWDESIDQPVAQASFTLRREAREGSLAPMMGGSRLNHDSFDPARPFAPLLQPGREIRILAATTYPGLDPAPDDWKGMFWGIIDEVDWGSSHRVKVSARDLGSRLLDTFIETKKLYAEGVALAPGVVMQQILDDALKQRLADGSRKAGAVVLEVEPDADGQPPEWAVHDLEQEQKNVLEALRDIALQFGWDVRYRWNAAHTEFKLTLYSPDRERPDPDDFDHDIGPSHYLDVSRLSVSHADVRNVVRVVYTEDETGERLGVTEEDEPSIAHFGRRFMEIEEASASLIDTPEEASALARYALHDLRDPIASQEVEMLFYWPVRVGDMAMFRANGVHYDADQRLAVIQLRHSLSREKQRTTLSVRGEPAGAYRDWLRRDVRVVGKEELPPQKPLIEVRMTEASSTRVSYEVEATSADGSPVTLYCAEGSKPFEDATLLSNPDIVTLDRETGAEDRMVRIWATTPLGGEEQQVLMADFDETPEIVFVNPPVALNRAGTQAGWLVTGAVDDDTRGLRIKAEGLQLGGTMPAAVAGAPQFYWMNVSTQKTFAIEVVQPMGDAGMLRLVPAQNAAPATPGVLGAEYELPLSRPPVTVATMRELSPTRRSVTFSVTPPGSTLNYRLLYGGATTGDWRLVPNLAAAFTNSDIDVSTADAVLEYFATSPQGVKEAVQRMRLDRDSAAGIVGVTLTEDPANFIRLNLDVDDDVVTWKVWARRGAAPVDDRTGAPDDTYLRYTGSRAQLHTGWYAAGDGDAATSTWHVLVHGYGYAGDADEVRATVLVNGSTPTVGFLRNVRSTVKTEGDKSYNDVIWDHNSVIENNPAEFTVSVYENDVLVASGRDVRYDHDEDEPGPGGLNVGGWHREVAAAPASDPDARYLTFRYRVELYHNGVLASTYHTSLSGRYRGSGTVVQTPTEVPVVSYASGGNEQATGYWSNTSTAWDVVVEWDYGESSAGPWYLSSSYVLPAGSTFHRGWAEPYAWARFRVAYTNAGGMGAMSAPSEAVYVSGPQGEVQPRLPGGGGGGTRIEEMV